MDAREAAEFDRLLEELRAATALVQCHAWWEQCRGAGIKGAEMVAEGDVHPAA
ncbi:MULTISPECIES: hypothetical protein [Streptomyces]|uniref:hypothetical protein n=1 Tax=Streptomyces TaxID=1883 RepID=UPI001367F858|nr:hypothetical protein [Streptomyces sp. SID685]